MIMRVYCVGKVHNMRLGSIMIMVANCVGKVYNMILW